MYSFPTGTAHVSIGDYIDAFGAQVAAEPLSSTEQDFLLLASIGLRSEAIADVRDTTVPAVKSRLQSARRKLCASTTASATYHALLCGVLAEDQFWPCPVLSERDVFIIQLVARGGVPANADAVSAVYRRSSSCRTALRRLCYRFGAGNAAQLVRMAWGWGPSPLACLEPVWFVSP